MILDFYNDFLNKPINGAQNFFWSEALELRDWGIFAMPDPFTVKKIERAAYLMERIRAVLDDRPILVRSWWRPYHYNAHIGSGVGSMHLLGYAVDFSVENLEANEVREILVQYLDTFEFCMENKPNSSWVHIDLGTPRPNTGRFFTP